MRPEDFDLLYQLEETYWWFDGMRTLADSIMGQDLKPQGQRLCDAGCGTGINLRHYEAMSHRVYGIDIAQEAVNWVRQRGFPRTAQASVTDLPFSTESFDAVFSFDVVCQVPNGGDNAAIHEMFRVLKPGGRLFIRVPAFEWLRSSHDAVLHTAHRYTAKELAGKLEDSGFRVLFATYANTFLFPVAVLRRMLKHLGIGKGPDVQPLPVGLGWLNPIFRAILKSERHFFTRGISLPFGLSVVIYAERPKNRLTAEAT